MEIHHYKVWAHNSVIYVETELQAGTTEPQAVMAVKDFSGIILSPSTLQYEL